jgi:hypothetical protein
MDKDTIVLRANVRENIADIDVRRCSYFVSGDIRMLDELNTVTARPSLCFSRTGLSRWSFAGRPISGVELVCNVVLN